MTMMKPVACGGRYAIPRHGGRSMNDISAVRASSASTVVDHADPPASDQAVIEGTAAELRVGDDILMNDWHLHVRRLDVNGSSVAFVVDEFPDIVHHGAASTVLHVASRTGSYATSRWAMPSHCAWVSAAQTWLTGWPRSSGQHRGPAASRRSASRHFPGAGPGSHWPFPSQPRCTAKDVYRRWPG